MLTMLPYHIAIAIKLQVSAASVQARHMKSFMMMN